MKALPQLDARIEDILTTRRLPYPKTAYIETVYGFLVLCAAAAIMPDRDGQAELWP